MDVCYAFLQEPYVSTLLIQSSEYCSISIKDEIEEIGLAFLPNPSNGRGVLEVDAKWLGKPFRIINLNGQTVHAGRISQSAQELDLAQLPPGMYVLQAGKEWEGSFKLIIQ
jgi:hypothetical protein